jgi:dipeptidyl aminopeptidase/acylaminoacyl peptidase
MHPTLRRSFWSLPLVSAFALPLALPAQAPTAASAPARAITPVDIAAWKTLRGATLSNDGAWFAYISAPNEGDAEVIVRQTIAGGKVHRFPIGEAPAGAAGMQLAADGKWVAMLVYPKAAEQKRLRTQRRPIQSKALVVSLTTGEQREFERVRRIAFGGESPKYIAMQAYGPDAPAGGGGGGGGGPAPGAPGMGGNLFGGGGGRVDGTDVLLHELGTTAVFNIGNVGDFAFDDKGRWLAYTIDAREQVGNGVQLRDLANGAVRSIDAGKALYRRLAWTDTLNAFAFLKGVADSANTDTTWAAVAVARVGAPTQQIVTVGTGSTVALPNGMEVSPDRAPRWMESLDGVVLGLRVASAPVPKAEQLEDDEKPTLILWHHKDPRLQSMQLVQEQADRGFSFLATYFPTTQKVVQLTDADVRTGNLGGRDSWLLAQEAAPYERQTAVDGIQRRDIYLINPKTGEKTLVKKELHANATLSPDGKSLLFWDDGNYHAYDIATKATVNLTKGAPVSFIDTEDDHNVDRPPTRVLGWSKDGRFALISDNYDVWRVGMAGNSFANLTGDGRAKGIRYDRRITIDPRERGVDLTKPVYMVAMQERTKKEAIVRIDPAKPGALALTAWRETRLQPMRARDADVWVSSIQTAARYPDYWRVTMTGGAITDSVRLSDANPNMNGIAWSAGSRLVNYVTDKGDSLQGALYLPANFEPGKKYPTLVYIYERQSDALNQFPQPTFSSSPNAGIGINTSRGYAVFLPDIVYKLNDPGMSAVWSVVPAVKAAIKTGIVDSANVGLHGHSWGGYQTAFLVGQTNIFKSAVAGAPLTDMVSMYSSVYWNTGSANQGIFQSSQGRFKGNFIENKDAYERNSPNRYADKVQTPLVILHDDKDGAVDFNQGITFYNTLRQLNKDVILLEYVGENHGLSQLKNRKDYSVRLMEYWDAYLKQQPAPEWLKNGIPRIKMDEHLREMKKKLEAKKIAM